MVAPLKTFKIVTAALIFLIVSVWPLKGFAVDYPSKPKGDIFVIDNANIISDSDEQIINLTSLNLRNEKSIPIVVVSIESLSQYKAEDLSIEAYARALFDEWEIGHAQYNYGMLLLVSKDDRKARIELGADWAGAGNENATYLMDKIIIRRFRLDKFSEGIREGVMGMDAMARGNTLPSPFLPKWVAALIYFIAFLTICLLTFTGISLIRSGRKGWGWAALGMAGLFLLFILKQLSNGQNGGFSNGGFSGGGSSGGGGATGGW